VNDRGAARIRVWIRQQRGEILVDPVGELIRGSSCVVLWVEDADGGQPRVVAEDGVLDESGLLRELRGVLTERLLQVRNGGGRGIVPHDDVRQVGSLAHDRGPARLSVQYRKKTGGDTGAGAAEGRAAGQAAG
jgi:hypothetical protein